MDAVQALQNAALSQYTPQLSYTSASIVKEKKPNVPHSEADSRQRMTEKSTENSGAIRQMVAQQPRQIQLSEPSKSQLETFKSGAIANSSNLVQGQQVLSHQPNLINSKPNGYNPASLSSVNQIQYLQQQQQYV